MGSSGSKVPDSDVPKNAKKWDDYFTNAILDAKAEKKRHFTANKSTNDDIQSIRELTRAQNDARKAWVEIGSAGTEDRMQQAAAAAVLAVIQDKIGPGKKLFLCSSGLRNIIDRFTDQRLDELIPGSTYSRLHEPSAGDVPRLRDGHRSLEFMY